jgi:hypothetical protein
LKTISHSSNIASLLVKIKYFFLTERNELSNPEKYALSPENRLTPVVVT